MKKHVCLVILLSLQILHCSAQESEAFYRFKASFLPVGLTYLTGYKQSANPFTDFYLSTATSGRSNTLSLELAYETNHLVIFFVRYEVLALPWPYDFYESDRHDYLEKQYDNELLSGGYEPLFSKPYKGNEQNGGETVLNGFSIGTGKAFRYKRFAVIPYLGVRMIYWKPYSFQATYKKNESNHYFKEQFNARNYMSIAPLAGVKVDFRISKRFGVTLEPLFALVPLKVAYDYSFQDSEGPAVRKRMKESFVLNTFQINTGAYYNFSKRYN